MAPVDEYEFAVSPAQARLLVLDRLHPDSTQYHVPAAFAVHGPFDVEAFTAALDALVARHESLRTVFRAEGGGLISIFYHPCEWVHQEFWDGVNFRRGANPPREQWKPPPQRSPEETEGAFQRFGQYIDHIRAIEPVRVACVFEEIEPNLTRISLRSKDEKVDVNEIAKQFGGGHCGKRAEQKRSAIHVLKYLALLSANRRRRVAGQFHVLFG